MPADLAITGRTLVEGGFRDATVLVADGRVLDVVDPGAGVEARVRHRLTDDEVLLPGLVDTHVHVNEPGRTGWEGFATATRAAAAGGITTLLDMPLNSLPPTVDPAALEVKRRAAEGQVHVDVGFWGGAVPSSLGHLAALHEAGVFGVKCFLVDSGVPEFPPLTWAEVDRALAELAGFDGLLLVHAEDAEVVGIAPHSFGPSYAGFVGSRPHQAEDLAVAGLLDLAARHRSRLHVLHLSSAQAVPRIAEARAEGVAVTVETCPHYLTLAAEEIPDGRPEYKCCPPIRGAANQDALWQALTEGTVDCVVSDHSPCPPALKQLESGDLGEAWGGIASLQLGLPLVWTEARARGVDLARVVGWMSQAPSRVAGLGGKGAVAPGRDADLVVLAPDERFVVDPARLHHRHPVTPYAGRELTGVVRDVWLRGGRIVTDGEVGAEATGRLLRRDDR